MNLKCISSGTINLKENKKNQGKFQIKESAPKEEKEESKETEKQQRKNRKNENTSAISTQNKSKNRSRILYVSS